MNIKWIFKATNCLSQNSNNRSKKAKNSKKAIVKIICSIKIWILFVQFEEGVNYLKSFDNINLFASLPFKNSQILS